MNQLDFKTVEEKEKEIDVEKHKTENIRNWQEPEACFVTFEADDAKETAEDASERNVNENSEKEAYTILGGKKKFIVEEICSEPTDIIWQNRYLTSFELCQRGTVAISFSILLLCLSFMALFWISGM